MLQPLADLYALTLCDGTYIGKLLNVPSNTPLPSVGGVVARQVKEVRLEQA